jgi:hypothetical protein
MVSSGVRIEGAFCLGRIRRHMAIFELQVGQHI